MIVASIPTDPLGLAFTGQDHMDLARALMAAYPAPAQLDRMLVARLNVPLVEVTAPYPLIDATFDVVTHFKAKGHLLRLIAAASASNPDNPELAVFASRFGSAAATPSTRQLEKLVRQTSVPFPIAMWRERLARRERCVCRVEVALDGRTSFGTGFLVGPDLVLTNHHVIAGATETGRAARSAVVCRFDFKQEPVSRTVFSEGLTVGLAEDWLVAGSPHSAADLVDDSSSVPSANELDFALLRLESRIGDQPLSFGDAAERGAPARGWIALPAGEWNFTPEDALFIIQHPRGGPMQLALDADARAALNGNGTRVTYKTGTEPGSSGSPCFNRFWNLIALHHGADSLYPQFDARGANRGIPMARIADRLRAAGLREDELSFVDPAAWND